MFRKKGYKTQDIWLMM